jgi:hypothetical protein
LFGLARELLRNAVTLKLFGPTIFLGAFLLFQVQPLMAKFILPWFGGGPGVWTACMLFFQVFLLAGYVYPAMMASASCGPFGRIGCRGTFRL